MWRLRSQAVLRYIKWFPFPEIQIWNTKTFLNQKKESQKRVIIEYDAKTNISVKYHEKEKRIVFNHLIPPKKDLEGLEEYYIPEGTFNAYQYKQGKWWLQQDVDIRNQEKVKKIKKINRGLIPR